MNAEELLKNVENITTLEFTEEYPETEKERERLSAIIAGGNSRKYLGREVSLSDIDSMNGEEIKKLYCKYESRLGASMTKTLGNTFINLYVIGVSNFFNIKNTPQLIKDLEEDPFVNNALTSTCCELYYRFGMYLAPFTAALTTAKHVEGLKTLEIRDEVDNSENLENYENLENPEN